MPHMPEKVHQSSAFNIVFFCVRTRRRQHIIKAQLESSGWVSFPILHMTDAASRSENAATKEEGRE